MGLAALGIPAFMLTSTTSKEDEKFIYRALEKGEGELKILYVTPEKISKSKRFMSKLEKCHHAGRLSLIAIDVSGYYNLNRLLYRCNNISFGVISDLEYLDSSVTLKLIAAFYIYFFSVEGAVILLKGI